MSRLALSGIAEARAVLAEGVATLAGAGLPTARPDAEWLLAALLGVDRFRLYVDAATVGTARAARYRELISRRAAHEPLQYLLGWEEFRGLRIAVSRDTLIPRPETEGLVEWALALLPAAGTACDLGTGSGCIACAIVAARPDSRVLAVDRSLAALRVATGNVQYLGGAERVRLVATDALGAVRPGSQAFDLIVANAPYIPSSVIATLPREVRDWEPGEALDGGPDGMALQRRIIAEAPGCLRGGGWLILEIGEGQAPTLARLMTDAGFLDVEVRPDFLGVDRYLGGRTLRDSSAAAPDRRATDGSSVKPDGGH